MAVPVQWGSAPLPPCGRISLLKKHAGVDVQNWYPNHPSTPEAAQDWTYDTQLKMAEDLFKAGYPIGFGCGSGSTDANQVWGATFGAFGADLVDAKGNITVESDNVMKVMEYCLKHGEVHAARRGELGRCLEQPGADLRQGGADLEPALGLGGGQARRAADRGGLLAPSPRRAAPKGRLVPHRPYFWGVWKFAQNKRAANDIIEYLSQREQVETLAAAVVGL